MSNNNESYVLGLWRNYKAKQEKKALLQRVSKENDNNKNIAYCPPTPIEAFFGQNDDLGNMIFSGSSQVIRNRAIKCIVQNAVGKGWGVVILHQCNHEIENYIKQNVPNTTVFNRSTSNYDPFVGMANAEINRMIQDSSVQCCEIKGVSQYYLDGVTEFIRSKKVSPCCSMYITCPHLTIFDKLDAAETKGKISSVDALRIRTLLMQGQAQRYDIENYFSILANQAQGILSSPKNISHAISLKKLIQKKGVAVVDVMSVNNKLFLNLLMCDIMAACNHGYPLLLIIEGISLASNDMLMQFVNNSGYHTCSVLSGDDIFASVNGDDKILSGLLGKASKCLIGQHTSGQSCEMFAKYIGQYDKKETDMTLMQSKQYQSMFSVIPGQMNGSGIHIATKKEYRVTPEEISKMEALEYYVMDGGKSTLFHAFSI